LRMLLAGDIGATKTRLGIFPPGDVPRQPLTEMTFANVLYPDLSTIVREFLNRVKVQVDRACFGVAGPVAEKRATLTNLPWIIDEDKLGRELDIPSVCIINDTLAAACALPFLSPGDLHTLNKGNPVLNGNMAVIAPGTGLGEAFLTWDGRRYRGYASEGGHGDFAPNNDLEAELFRCLHKKWGHVSYDRVCSGRGIPEIYRFLKETGRDKEPPWLAERLAAASDATPVIVKAALDGEDTSGLCVKTLEIFVSVLGAEAGNLALKVMATGGVYVTGGLPPRILSFLAGGGFLEAFRRKGRMSELVAHLPVHVVLDASVALRGAACCLINDNRNR
jgi:glucokinase